jgi:hypothetical protein
VHVTSRTSALGGLLIAAVSIPSAARADDKKVCAGAYAQAQSLRDDHKLVEARQQLRLCSQPTCKAFIVKDCTSWLLDVDSRVPSVVLSAKDAQGNGLTDVSVSMDGAPLTKKLDGDSIEVDPGAHTFTFTAADGTKTDQAATVLEGQKTQAIAVTVPTAASVAAAAAAKEQAPGGSSAATASPVRASSGSGTPVVGWILGGAGVAGLSVGAVAGIMALTAKSAAHCDSDGVCDPGSTSGIKSAALVSDIGWIGGGVLLAAGGALIVFSPSHAEGAATVELAPVLTASSAGAVVGGSW